MSTSRSISLNERGMIYLNVISVLFSVLAMVVSMCQMRRQPAAVRHARQLNLLVQAHQRLAGQHHIQRRALRLQEDNKCRGVPILTGTPLLICRKRCKTNQKSFAALNPPRHGGKMGRNRRGTRPRRSCTHLSRCAWWSQTPPQRYRWQNRSRPRQIPVRSSESRGPIHSPGR